MCGGEISSTPPDAVVPFSPNETLWNVVFRAQD